VHSNRIAFVQARFADNHKQIGVGPEFVAVLAVNGRNMVAAGPLDAGIRTGDWALLARAQNKAWQLETDDPTHINAFGPGLVRYVYAESTANDNSSLVWYYGDDSEARANMVFPHIDSSSMVFGGQQLFYNIDFPEFSVGRSPLQHLFIIIFGLPAGCLSYNMLCMEKDVKRQWA